MIKQAYITGFMRKCAEYRVNPQALIKCSLDTASFWMPTIKLPIQQLTSTQKAISESRPAFMTTYDKLRKAMEKVLAKKQKSQPAKTRQPLLITR